MTNKPLLILCLGNEIVSDDAFGPAVSRALRDEPDLNRHADILFAPVAGFHLLDLFQGRDKILIVDTIVTGTAAAGTLHSFPAGVLTPSKHLTTSHQISLPTALELGKRLGLKMPEVVDVVAVEAQDLETLSEELTQPVRDALDGALARIRAWVAENAVEDVQYAGKQ
ncbi:MAG TPA: hydrogenase maturation protease [bacterium]